MVAIGGSSGAVRAISMLLGGLPASFPAAVAVVVHRGHGGDENLERHLARQVRLEVALAVDKLPLAAGSVYVAPGGYHLLVERSGALALSLDRPVHHCRPSVDVLFESVADAFGARSAAVLLTGYGADGARGLRAIAAAGGRTAIQNPDSAEVPDMVKAARELVEPDAVLDLERIPGWLVEITARHTAPGRGPAPEEPS